MLEGQFVFTQLMEVLPRREFNACVQRYGGQRRPLLLQPRPRIQNIYTVPFPLKNTPFHLQQCGGGYSSIIAGEFAASVEGSTKRNRKP